MATGKVGFFGVRETFVRGSVDNTGNIIHSQAARRMFSEHARGEVSPTEDAATIEQIRETYSHLGWVGATTIRLKGGAPAQRYREEAALIERAGLPVIPFGLGCDADLNHTVREAVIDPDTERLLKTIADYAPIIAVRGAFTADLLGSIGIHNVQLTGCQSAYFGTVLNEVDSYRRRDGQRAYVTMTDSPEEEALLLFAIENGLDYVGQVDQFAERLHDESVIIDDYYVHRGIFFMHRKGILKNALRSADGFVNALTYILQDAKALRHGVAQFGAPQYLERALERGMISQFDYNQYIKAFFRKFYYMDEWVTYIQENYDFGFGTRFHGNMAGLIAGVPALWLVHDMRTKELCDLLELPAIPLTTFAGCRSVEALKDACVYDNYVGRFPAKLMAFLRYFDYHGVTSLLDRAYLDRCARWLGRETEAVTTPCTQ